MPLQESESLLLLDFTGVDIDLCGIGFEPSGRSMGCQ
jgi:hypothetical protein